MTPGADDDGETGPISGGSRVADSEKGVQGERADVASENDPQAMEMGEGSIEEGETEEGGNVAGSLDAYEPLEPQSIDLENALFVLLGVMLVAGFLFLGIQGML